MTRLHLTQAATIALMMISGAVSGCGKPEETSAMDDMLGAMERDFATLINGYQRGKAERMPWAGYFWPYVSDGIATHRFAENTGRWFNPRREGATAKYDRARRSGGSRGSADAWERKNHGRGVRGVEDWWGHCNGWSAAAALWPEPRKPARVDGVDFTVADTKALLTEIAMEVEADFFGDRDRRDDVVPNQFFLVLTNYVGRAGRTVLFDRHTGPEVWNHPLAGYRFEYPKPSDYLGPDRDNPGVHKINMTATLWWVRDDVKPGTLTPPGFDYADNEVVQSRTLRMELWLDGPVEFNAAGRVRSSGDVIGARESDAAIGGAWRMGNGYTDDGWPDYLWVPRETLPSSGYSNPELDAGWIRERLLPASL